MPEPAQRRDVYCCTENEASFQIMLGKCSDVEAIERNEPILR